MDAAKIFAVALICQYIGISSTYLLNGDWRKSIYWISSAIVTAVVTW